MGLLARAPATRLLDLWQVMALCPARVWLRAPEIGAVMLRGRMGAVGASFNLGELTVTRCALRLEETGAVGHALVSGRDVAKAEVAALVDALMQTEVAAGLREGLLAPLQAEENAARTARAARAAATRVEFFTLARGED
ncbi:MAG: phosphonate C-P lyase system protein PhnG [Rhodobacteraceae bacterium]|nr:phosphonate C-P lyase system protein PhnG [Paracoccaceae bacterium]